VYTLPTLTQKDKLQVSLLLITTVHNCRPLRRPQSDSCPYDHDMPTAHSVPRSLLNESGICSLSSLLSVRSKSEALTVASITGAPEGLLCRQPVEGLPTGWTRILVRRKNGNYKGKDDPYYFSPLQSYKFNSLVKVKRFLVCLEEAGGDEAAAYVNFRGGSNAGQTEAKIKASITMEKKRKIFAMDPSVADTRDTSRQYLTAKHKKMFIQDNMLPNSVKRLT